MGNFRKHSPRVFWSEAEVNILMEHYPSLSAAELLEKLPGRTIRVSEPYVPRELGYRGRQ